MHLEISCAADFRMVQQNIDSVSEWISSGIKYQEV